MHCEGFKGINGKDFTFKPLTVLTGTNCSGKSSIIQSILLARLAEQTAVSLGNRAANSQENKTTIPLNGPFGLRLGAASEVFSFDSSHKGVMQITFCNGKKEFSFSFQSDDYNNRYLTCTIPPEFLFSHSTGSFTYISAIREGQPDLLPMQSHPESTLEIGYRGEYAAEVLRVFEKRTVAEPLRHKDAGALPLTKQVEAWMGEFVPSVALRVETCSVLDAVGLRYLQGGAESEWVRPSNTGFGLSYCLPIVVAGLLGSPGSTLIIDSPEAHLHPSAQSAMGQFLARLAALGIQTIIETHSDHIINGIRLASLEKDHPFNGEDAQFHFLFRNESGLVNQAIEITPSGALSHYPDAFFDQTEIDLRRIVEARRKDS